MKVWKNCKFIVILVIFSVAIAIVSCKNDSGQSGQIETINTESETELERWEYTTSDYKIENANKLGQEGWELVSVITTGLHSDVVRMYFKRKLPINTALED